MTVAELINKLQNECESHGYDTSDINVNISDENEFIYEDYNVNFDDSDLPCIFLQIL